MKGDLEAPYKNINTGLSATPRVEQEADFIGFTLGHGFSFVLKNSNHISVDLIATRQLKLSRNILEDYQPEFKLDRDKDIPSFTTFGIRVLINI